MVQTRDGKISREPIGLSNVLKCSETQENDAGGNLSGHAYRSPSAPLGSLCPRRRLQASTPFPCGGGKPVSRVGPIRSVRLSLWAKPLDRRMLFTECTMFHTMMLSTF